MGLDADSTSGVTLNFTKSGFTISVPPRGFCARGMLGLYFPALVILSVLVALDVSVFRPPMPLHPRWSRLVIENLILLIPVIALLMIPLHYGSREATIIGDSKRLALTYMSLLSSSDQSWLRQDIRDIGLRARWYTVNGRQRYDIRLLDSEGYDIGFIYVTEEQQSCVVKYLKQGLGLGKFGEVT